HRRLRSAGPVKLAVFANGGSTMAKSTNPGKGTGSVRKNRSNAGRTTARKGKRKSAMARAKSHVRRSSRAGRANARVGGSRTAEAPASDRRTTFRIARPQSSQSAGKDPDRDAKFTPGTDAG